MQKIDIFRLRIVNQIKRTKLTEKPQKEGFSFLEALGDMASPGNIILI